MEEEERFPELSLSYSSIIFSRSSSEVTEMRASRSSPGSWYLMRSKEGEGGEGEGEGEGEEELGHGWEEMEEMEEEVEELW